MNNTKFVRRGGGWLHETLHAVHQYVGVVFSVTCPSKLIQLFISKIQLTKCSLPAHLWQASSAAFSLFSVRNVRLYVRLPGFSLPPFSPLPSPQYLERIPLPAWRRRREFGPQSSFRKLERSIGAKTFRSLHTKHNARHFASPVAVSGPAGAAPSGGGGGVGLLGAAGGRRGAARHLPRQIRAAVRRHEDVSRDLYVMREEGEERKKNCCATGETCTHDLSVIFLVQLQEISFGLSNQKKNIADGR